MWRLDWTDTLDKCLFRHQSDIVDMCLGDMQSELAMLRAEVRTLADQLKDAENLVSSQVSSLR